MTSSELVFNGLDATTGEYLHSPVPLLILSGALPPAEVTVELEVRAR